MIILTIIYTICTLISEVVMSELVLFLDQVEELGASMAKTFSDAGYRVAINYFKSEEKANEVLKECLLNRMDSNAMSVIKIK